jgi:diketogulonate reductase-like aldo/keto reductase
MDAPALLYGTAWKEDDTERCVTDALAAGFRGIDTANQRKHYFEAGVGKAVQRAIARGLVTRDQLFLQTKFTFIDGQDHRLPYDSEAPIATQVQQSVRSSCEHLGVTVLDSYVLHGPSSRFGWHAEDIEAWEAMEALADQKLVARLGVSNVSVDQLQALLQRARVKPAFVQNRCYARFGWDAKTRGLCHERGVRYQGFSLLTANPQVVGHAQTRAIAKRRELTVEQVVLRFAVQLGILPLTGTTDVTHMKQDLSITGFELDATEVATLSKLA